MSQIPSLLAGKDVPLNYTGSTVTVQLRTPNTKAYGKASGGDPELKVSAEEREGWFQLGKAGEIELKQQGRSGDLGVPFPTNFSGNAKIYPVEAYLTEVRVHEQEARIGYEDIKSDAGKTTTGRIVIKVPPGRNPDEQGNITLKFSECPQEVFESAILLPFFTLPLTGSEVVGENQIDLKVVFNWNLGYTQGQVRGKVSRNYDYHFSVLKMLRNFKTNGASQTCDFELVGIPAFNFQRTAVDTAKVKAGWAGNTPFKDVLELYLRVINGSNYKLAMVGKCSPLSNLAGRRIDSLTLEDVATFSPVAGYKRLGEVAILTKVEVDGQVGYVFTSKTFGSSYYDFFKTCAEYINCVLTMHHGNPVIMSTTVDEETDISRYDISARDLADVFAIPQAAEKAVVVPKEMVRVRITGKMGTVAPQRASIERWIKSAYGYTGAFTENPYSPKEGSYRFDIKEDTSGTRKTNLQLGESRYDGGTKANIIDYEIVLPGPPQNRKAANILYSSYEVSETAIKGTGEAKAKTEFNAYTPVVAAFSPIAQTIWEKRVGTDSNLSGSVFHAEINIDCDLSRTSQLREYQEITQAVKADVASRMQELSTKWFKPTMDFGNLLPGSETKSVFTETSTIRGLYADTVNATKFKKYMHDSYGVEMPDGSLWDKQSVFAVFQQLLQSGLAVPEGLNAALKNLGGRIGNADKADDILVDEYLRLFDFYITQWLNSRVNEFSAQAREKLLKSSSRLKEGKYNKMGLKNSPITAHLKNICGCGYIHSNALILLTDMSMFTGIYRVQFVDQIWSRNVWTTEIACLWDDDENANFMVDNKPNDLAERGWYTAKTLLKKKRT